MANSIAHPYAGARAALATMHGKGRAIAPPLLRGAGLEVITPPGLDTDVLGTFTGDVPRAGSMEEAAHAKARMAMAATGLPLALASEGAYGPHPMVPFLAQGLELLLFCDQTRGIEVIERLPDPRPRYAQAEVECAGDLRPFLAAIRFPRTCVTVSAGPYARPIARAVADAQHLAGAVDTAARMSPTGRAFVQSDMRADRNPRRMALIRALAARMAQRLATRCPACDCPGFGHTGTLAGLPCADCGTPTARARGEIHSCPACRHTETRPRRDGLATASPAECPACNP